LSVAFNQCLEVCETLISASCTATLADTDIAVTGEARVRYDCVTGQAYPNVCTIVRVQCLLPEAADPSSALVTVGTDPVPLGEVPKCGVAIDTGA
jgi:hypothetical protein